MEARGIRLLIALLAIACIAATPHRTPNFVVNAPTPEIAQQVGSAAEHYRKQLSIEWLGQELPNWSHPCPIHVKVGQMGAGGATSFNFANGEVFGWNMNIQGSLERILDSVLPHEISHTIFACYFRRPLPRWADEGAATLSEAECERRRQELTVRQILGTQQRIPLRTLIGMRDYPKEMRDVLTLYAEGYSLADLLVRSGGKTRYLRFLVDAEAHGWDIAVKTHYGYTGVDALEARWQKWVMAGESQQRPGELLVSTPPAAGHVPSTYQAGAVAPVSAASGSGGAVGTNGTAAPPAAPPAATQVAAASRGTEAAHVAPPVMIVRGQDPGEDPFLEDERLRPNPRIAAATTGARTSNLTAPAPRRKAIHVDGLQRNPPIASQPRPPAADQVETTLGLPSPLKALQSAAAGAVDAQGLSTLMKTRESAPRKALPLARNATDPTSDAAPAAGRKRRPVQWSEFPQDDRFSPLSPSKTRPAGGTPRR